MKFDHYVNKLSEHFYLYICMGEYNTFWQDGV